MPNVFIAHGDQRRHVFEGLDPAYLRRVRTNELVLEYVPACEVTLAFLYLPLYSASAADFAAERLGTPPFRFLVSVSDVISRCEWYQSHPEAAEQQYQRDLARQRGEPPPVFDNSVEEPRPFTPAYCHPLTNDLFLGREEALETAADGLAAEAHLLLCDHCRNMMKDVENLDRQSCLLLYQIEQDRLTPQRRNALLATGASQVCISVSVAGDYLDLGRKKYAVSVRESGRPGTYWYGPLCFDTLQEAQAALAENGWQYVEAGSYSPWDTFEIQRGSQRAIADLTITYLLSAETLVRASGP